MEGKLNFCEWFRDRASAAIPISELSATLYWRYGCTPLNVPISRIEWRLPLMRSGESETPPIYKQLSSEISDRINRGKLSPGEQLPSERELGLRHKISRMTARQVYRHLEERGLVSRSDRRGWFVAEGPFQFSLTRSASFTNNLMAQGIQTGMEVLHCARIRAPSLVRMSLRLRNGQYVQSIKRLLAIRGQPALTETV